MYSLTTGVVIMKNRHYYWKFSYLSLFILSSFVFYSPGVSASAACVAQCMNDFRDNPRKHVESNIKSNMARRNAASERCSRICNGKSSFNQTLM